MSASLWGRKARGVAVASIVVIGAVPPTAALAGHMTDWRHDHSTRGVPSRPHGYSALRSKFGSPCGSRANDARTLFPHASGRNKRGYVYYHPYLARNVGHNIRGHVSKRHKDQAFDYGQYGYNCRRMRGSSSWSTHAFGAAIDTNTARNPQGQSYWNGRGADGQDHGMYIPDVFRGDYPGHGFRWGKSWRDPHHFQYVTGY